MKHNNKYQNKNHLINVKNKLTSSTIHFGTIGLISLENNYINSKELESCKKIILKKIKSKGTLIVKTNPFLGVTSKPLATRMGKGKGMISKWVLPAKKGTVIFEIRCNKINLINSKEAFTSIQQNLSVKTKIISNIY